MDHDKLFAPFRPEWQKIVDSPIYDLALVHAFAIMATTGATAEQLAGGKYLVSTLHSLSEHAPAIQPRDTKHLDHSVLIAGRQPPKPATKTP